MRNLVFSLITTMICSTNLLAQGGTPRLIINNLDYPIKIIESETNKFVFPDSKKYGLKIFKNDNNDYILENTTSITNSRIYTNSGNSTQFNNTGGGTQFNNSIGGDQYIETLQIGGTINNNSGYNRNELSNKKKDTIIIAVPQDINLDLFLINNIVVTAKINTLKLSISGTSKAYFKRIATIPFIDLFGIGSVIIDTVTTINDIDISGLGHLVIGSCFKIDTISISGKAVCTVPSTTEIISQDISNFGELNRKK